MTNELAHELIGKLHFLQSENRRRPITLSIDSMGGLVSESLAVIDMMNFVDLPVHTRCEANAHSLAAVMLASGATGERVIVQGSRLSLPSLRMYQSCQPGEPVATSDDLRQIQQKVAIALAEAIGCPAAALAAGRQFDAAAAVEYGLADRVE